MIIELGSHTQIAEGRQLQMNYYLIKELKASANYIKEKISKPERGFG